VADCCCNIAITLIDPDVAFPDEFTHESTLVSLQLGKGARICGSVGAPAGLLSPAHGVASSAGSGVALRYRNSLAHLPPAPPAESSGTARLAHRHPK
jgi:hypothetical protein